jgi:hypothetical protein
MFFYIAKTSTALSFYHQIELSLSSPLDLLSPDPSNFSVLSPCILACFPALASSTSLSRFISPRCHILLHHSSMQAPYSLHQSRRHLLAIPSQTARSLLPHASHAQSEQTPPLKKIRSAALINEAAGLVLISHSGIHTKCTITGQFVRSPLVRWQPHLVLHFRYNAFWL